MNDSNSNSSSDLSSPIRGTGGLRGQGAFSLSLLVAASENNVIGKDNKLPWHLPNDLRYFKNLTWGMPILMGRKTFESIGRALPGRKNIVITRRSDWRGVGVSVVHSIEEAVKMANEDDVKEIFIIGGAEIFNSALPQANCIYLTRIHDYFEGDVFFPPLSTSEWTLTQSHTHSADEKNQYAHTFQVWRRK
ncbi:MAG: dihydrofolate reductase [Flavisolibacter sp.]|nr:dihydrofolate reductase [Flavisolibacter sp.]